MRQTTFKGFAFSASAHPGGPIGFVGITTVEPTVIPTFPSWRRRLPPPSRTSEIPEPLRPVPIFHGERLFFQGRQDGLRVVDVLPKCLDPYYAVL